MLGENIRKARKKMKMSQEELAHALGVSQGSVSLWERGEVEPSIPTTKEIAKVLRVAFADLVDDDFHPRPQTVPILVLDGDPVMGWADDKPETQAIARELYAMALNIGATKEDVDAFRNYMLLTKGEQNYINNSMKFLRSQRKEEEGT